MHIVLLILKIIGIIILSLLGLLLTLVFLVLFVPLRYCVNGQKEGDREFEAEVKVSWLLHILTFVLEYKEKASYRVRIFGITAWKGTGDVSSRNEAGQKKKKATPARQAAEKRKKSKKKKIQEHKDTSLEEPLYEDTFEESEETIQQQMKELDGSAEKQEQEFSKKQEIIQTKTGKTKGGSIFEKVKQFFLDCWQKLKVVIHKVRTCLRDICSSKDKAVEKVEIIKDFWNNKDNKAGIRALWKYIKKLAGHIRPKKWNYQVRVGTGDPAQMGQLLGVISAFGGMAGRMPNIIPEFNEKVLEGHFFMKGRLQVYYVLWLLLKIWRDDEVNKVRRNFKKVRRKL